MEFQGELFNRLPQQGWRFVAQGAFSRVYVNDSIPQWIIKRGANDGTRTYLEWCILKRQRGEWMKGMPEVDWVLGLEGDAYMASMRRYYPARDWVLSHGRPKYLTELADAFNQDVECVSMNDMHCGNIMSRSGNVKESSLVLTDPSSDAYIPLALGCRQCRRNDFALTMQ